MGTVRRESRLHPLKHLKTINHHKWLVFVHCWKCGLYKQAFLHDMSKYAPVEFWAGAKYYQGVRSPNNAQREAEGVSAAWLHHKGRNKHHLEYWVDYSLEDGQLAGMEMPVKYVVEMICDRIAASKNYQGAAYTRHHPLQYYNRGKGHYLLHPKTRALMEELLELLDREGEEALFRYIRTQVLHNAKG